MTGPAGHHRDRRHPDRHAHDGRPRPVGDQPHGAGDVRLLGRGLHRWFRFVVGGRRGVLRKAGVAFSNAAGVPVETDDDGDLEFRVRGDDDALEIEGDDRRRSAQTCGSDDEPTRVVTARETSLVTEGELKRAWAVQVVEADDDGTWDAVTLLTQHPKLIGVGTSVPECDVVDADQVRVPGYAGAIEADYEPDDDDLGLDQAIARLSDPDHQQALAILASARAA